MRGPFGGLGRECSCKSFLGIYSSSYVVVFLHCWVTSPCVRSQRLRLVRPATMTSRRTRTEQRSTGTLGGVLSSVWWCSGQGCPRWPRRRGGAGLPAGRPCRCPRFRSGTINRKGGPGGLLVRRVTDGGGGDVAVRRSQLQPRLRTRAAQPRCGSCKKARKAVAATAAWPSKHKVQSTNHEARSTKHDSPYAAASRTVGGTTPAPPRP